MAVFLCFSYDFSLKRLKKAFIFKKTSSFFWLVLKKTLTLRRIYGILCPVRDNIVPAILYKRENL